MASTAVATFTTFSNLWMSKYEGQTSFFDCPFPCQETSYEFKVRFYHINTWIDVNEAFPKPEDRVLLGIYYRDLLREKSHRVWPIQQLHVVELFKRSQRRIGT